ncbi:MAG: tRNA dihydrouridine synthase DusB [Acidobacteria bacterium]|nr:tRNA dihydrouridine synthase DusB [Acidobacteriota bacterium]
MFRIGSIPVHSPFVLAPMASVTDTHFRRTMKRLGGCGFVYSQLISVEGIVRESQKTLDMMRYSEEERPVAIQLFGSDPSTMAEAAGKAAGTRVDMIDINVGCPAKKVVKGGGGCGLMREPELLCDIIAAVRSVLAIPLTLKIRAGWDERSRNFLHVAQMARRCGVDAVTLHPRTRIAEFSGSADWSLITELKKEMDIPVIGSGDVRTPEDALRMLEKTGCDAVMIGRAATANPWIFRQSWDLLTSGGYQKPDRQRTWEVLFGLFDGIIRDLPAAPALAQIKNLAGRFSKNLPDSIEFRNAIFQSRDIAQAREILAAFFQVPSPAR